MKGSAALANILIASSRNNFSLLISKIYLLKYLAFNLKNHFRKIFPLKLLDKKDVINKCCLKLYKKKVKMFRGTLRVFNKN